MQLTRLRGLLFIFFLSILSAYPFSVHAQISDSARVSVLTIYPGEAIYALWGHSALRIWDPTTGFDISYNYGTFDFRSPLSFMARFAYGKLDYQLSLHRSQALVEHSWVTEGRGVVQQHLDMNQQEIQTLYELLRVNALPENRVYRYDFLYDNCATRILEVLEDALDVQLVNSQSVGISFRDLIRPYLRTKPALDVAINVAMGIPVDEFSTRRQLSFLPIEFQILLENAQKRDQHPLVAQTDTLFGEPISPTPRQFMSIPTWIGWILCLIALYLSVRDFRTPRRRRFDVIFMGMVSMIGLLITFFWLVSVHEITRPNLHIMWAWPLHLIPLWFSKWRWASIYWWTSGVSATLFALGSMWWPQDFPMATIPLALALAMRCFILAKVPRTGFEPVLPA